MPDSGAVRPGDTLAPLRLLVNRATLVRYAGASGDFNEIHYSDRRALAIGLPGVVAHGMLTMGAGLRVVTDWAGDPARVVAYSVRFTRPVVVPDSDAGTTIDYAATVTDVVDGRAHITITATCQGQGVLGAARAEVLLD